MTQDPPGADATASTPHRSAPTPARPGQGTRLTKRDAAVAGLLLALLLLGLSAIWTATGLLLTGPLAPVVDPIDRQIATWLVEQRTSALDGWSLFGSMLAETWVKVVLTIGVGVGMYLAWRSFSEPFLVGFALIIEATAYLVVTLLVGRPRPDVPALDLVVFGTSFPSGHAAAAVVYAAITIVVFERTRSPWIRAGAVVLTVAIPLAVGIARVYRGLHYLTDVLAGFALGAASVGGVYLIVRVCFDRPDSAA
jgi:membrane-associated phospholipid phosphatase